MLAEHDLIRVYRETVQELYRFVFSRTGADRQLAEDFVQETYMRALSDWRQKGVPREPVRWLKTVARNLVVSHYRRIEPASLMRMEPENLDLRKELERMENSALVYWGLSRLNKRRAELLEAFHFDAQPVRRIAEEMGISERAVEGRLRRAREALKMEILEMMGGQKV